MTDKVQFDKLMPWEQLPDVWKTKAAYFQWLRGQMRKAWSRHPVKNAYKAERRVKARVGKRVDKLTGLHDEVWALPCDQCGYTFPQGLVEVDHIIQAGSFKEWADCEAWLMRLMQINFAGLQLLCKPCHSIKSYAETNKLSFEDASLEKRCIAWIKSTDTVDQQQFLIHNGGFDAKEVTNPKGRRACYRAYLEWSDSQ
jgi:hypothetical protein